MWELLFGVTDVRAAADLRATATGSNLQRRFSSDAPSTLGPESGSYRAADTFVAMASNACNILEAALERMDDFIAGKSYFIHYLKNTTASLGTVSIHTKMWFETYTNGKQLRKFHFLVEVTQFWFG